MNFMKKNVHWMLLVIGVIVGFLAWGIIVP